MIMIKIQDVLRAGHIKRWNIINTTREQTLAEHLFNVAMITQTLCDRCGIDQDITEVALEWALVHDIPEVVCGDTPSPTKRRMKSMGMDMENLHEKIDPTYARIKHEAIVCGADYIVKFADLLESVHFLKENGQGRHAIQVCKNLETKLWHHMRLGPPYMDMEDTNSVIVDVLEGDTYE